MPILATVALLTMTSADPLTPPSNRPPSNTAQSSTRPSKLVEIPVSVPFPAKGSAVFTRENLDPSFEFNELIPSWNVKNSSGAAVRIELRVRRQKAVSRWFNLGDWSALADWAPRQSEEDQADDFGRVLTDTLRLREKVDRFDIRVTLRTKPGSKAGKLTKLVVSLADTNRTLESASLEEGVERKLSGDVPQRAQGRYPRGNVLCSPTSLSMLLWHYSNVLQRPSLNKDVPEVEASVWDPVYKGAGNWSFNMAYAGSFQPLKAYVSRLHSLRDLEELTAAGFPVACSVSFDLLRGRPLSKSESGHLVVCVGFQSDGTPVINDPAFKDQVRKTYPRADFEKAWCYSHRTVYLVVPETTKLPDDSLGRWNPVRL